MDSENWFSGGGTQLRATTNNICGFRGQSLLKKIILFRTIEDEKL